MPDDESGCGLKRGEGHVVVIAVAQDGRVRVVPCEHRVQVRAIAEIGPALALQAHSGRRCLVRHTSSLFTRGDYGQFL